MQKWIAVNEDVLNRLCPDITTIQEQLLPGRDRVFTAMQMNEA